MDLPEHGRNSLPRRRPCRPAAAAPLAAMWAVRASGPSPSRGVASPFVSVMSALHASAAVLLVAAGATKLSRPAGGSAALLGFQTRAGVVRLIGALEAAAGVAALLVGGPAVWAVGLLYAVFALVVLRAVLAGADSCGCFGRLDAPPSLIHVVGNLVLAAVSFGAAGASSPPIPAVVQAMGDSPAVGAAQAAVVALLAGLLLVSFTALPEALGARVSGFGAAGLFRALPSPATSRAATRDAVGRR